MNWIDLLLIIIILLCLYNGYLKGFIIGAVELVTLAAGLVGAFLTYPYIAAFLEKYWASLGIWTVPLSFIFALLLFRIILSLLSNRFLTTVPTSAYTSTVNHVLGIIPGAINGLIWAAIISAVLLTFPLSDGLSAKTRDSATANLFSDKIEWLNEKISPVFDEAINKTMSKLTVEPKSEKSIILPYKVEHPKTREDLETKMLVLVNEERQRAGLKPLQPDTAMTVVARKHSADMFARGYFSHITPEGLSPFDRMKREKIRFLTAGENLALGQTLSICHRGLMNSPGHRANILQPAFGRLGIGILDGGIYGLMITQNFRN